MNKYRNKKAQVDMYEFDSIEDVKGLQTDVFKLKHKLFEKKYPDLELRIIK